MYHIIQIINQQMLFNNKIIKYLTRVTFKQILSDKHNCNKNYEIHLTPEEV